MSTPSKILALLPVLVASFAIAACSTESTDEAPAAQAEAPLKTADHRAITESTCQASAFPEAFCARLGEAAYSVDHNEWDDASAHGMPENGESHCDGAAKVQDRLVRLGSDLHARLGQSGHLSYEEVDKITESLGRALHTIQDNCAHEGMNNQQHAWYSIRETCSSTGEDPDTQPRALDCARTETRAILRSFADAVRASGHRLPDLETSGDIATPDPGAAQACSFLQESAQFDGKDGRWDDSVTSPAFRTTLTTAFKSGEASANVCDGLDSGPGGASPIAIRSPRPQVHVTPQSCAQIHVLCGG